MNEDDDIRNLLEQPIQRPNQPQQSFDQDRPRLKKVKRPVRRPMPGENPNAPVSPRPDYQQNRPQAPAQPRRADVETPEADAFNLDTFLDEEAKLPVAKNQRAQFNPANPQFVNDGDVDEAKSSIPFIVDGMFSKKAVGIIAAVVFVMGFLFAKMFFTEEKVVRDGLQGIVINAEVPRGRARCGVAEKTQGCVLYIMNPQRQELNARDFYDLAAQLTGRQRFLIETGNMRYSSVKIRPGEIAQLNIPPLQ